MSIRKPRYKKVPGSQVGKNSHKIIGCEGCNFAAIPKMYPELKTGKECPRCKEAKVRVFDSKAEHQRACELQMLQRNGNIKNLKYQPRFNLHATTPLGDKVKLYAYVADFQYEDVSPTRDIKLVIEDTKGITKSGQIVITDVAQMKIKHFEAEYGIEVKISGR